MRPMSSKLNFYDMAVGLRFLLGLPLFCRRRLDEATARAVVRRRLANRAANFLHLIKSAVYGRKQSPYARLLGQAGIEYPDLARLVREQGLEGALASLFHSGVYLTGDEFKGRRPVVRGSFSMRVNPDRLRNPYCGFHVPALTSGSGGNASPVLMGLPLMRDTAVNYLLGNLGRGSRAWSHAQWYVPGGLGIALVLEYSLTGITPQHWFSQVDPRDPAIHSRYRHSARVMRLGAALSGVRLPFPRYVPVSDPEPVVTWLQIERARGRAPHLRTLVSSALALCRWARDRKIDLSGVQLTVGGEPLSRARHQVITGTGAQVVPWYAAMEVRLMGIGCLDPSAVDDCHLQSDRNAFIQPGSQGPPRGLPPDTLLVSTLLGSASFIFINYSSGDRAEIFSRDCGCYLQGVGWHSHLRAITSFEKINAGGIALPVSNLTRVLEEVLPRRFGGGPNDYQLVEQEGPEGVPQLKLLVNPALGHLDPQRLQETFLEALEKEGEVMKLLTRLWQEAQYLRVERRAPLATASGKIWLVHKTTVNRGPDVG